MPLLESGLELDDGGRLVLRNLSFGINFGLCVLTDSLVPWHSILEHILSNKEFITFRSGMVDGWDGGLVTKKSEVFAPLFHN